MAVTAVRRCLPSLITSLEREAADRNDATAAGLATFCKDPRFLCTISMLDLPNQIESLKEFGIRGGENDITAFKEGVFQKYLDNVVNNLHERFPDNNILEALTIFDPELMDKGDPTFYEAVHFQKLQVLAGHFKSITCYETVKEEFLSFRFLLAKEMMLDLTFQESLLKVATMEDLYPSLARYAQIALVLPMSTADCERSFSTMNRVKTNLRNRLSQNILNSLMTISIEGQSLGEFDFDSCVKYFGQIKRRKISS
ncbi:uncharacterized protein [Argopecten irradians]|uniref:uncharacterized protein n=1 Tax=Argopecten irradians TaxID=31199 RepID=UPI00371FEB1B